MSNGVLPITNIVNVTVSGVPTGITARNVNNLALFTTDTPDNLDPYGVYLSLQQVGEDYGTTTVTYAMAAAIFSQSPNILTGNGSLIIIPYLGTTVAATSGNFVTANLSSNVAGLILIADGDLKVTIDTVDYELTGLDFTNCSDLDDINTVLQAALVNATLTASATAITATSKKVGAEADVTFAQLSGGTGTDLSGAGYFNTSAGTPTSGADASGETLVAAITRTEEEISYTGVITNLDMQDSVIVTTATAIQAKDMIFLHHFASTADIAGIATTIQAATDQHTRCLGYFQTLALANLMKAAYAGRAFSVNFSGSNTSQTINLKTLATITPDTNVNQTLYVAALAAGMDLYVSYDGVSSIYSTGGNLFFDQVYSRMALKFDLEAAGFNFLRQTNTKVPQTEQGMDGLKNAYNQVLEKFVRNNYIGVGLTWNSTTFGNPEDLNASITQKGYYTYSLPIAQQAQATRALREAPLVQIAVKEAGAIHTSDVTVIVEA